jgi:hypothetical protein
MRELVENIRDLVKPSGHRGKEYSLSRSTKADKFEDELRLMDRVGAANRRLADSKKYTIGFSDHGVNHWSYGIKNAFAGATNPTIVLTYFPDVEGPPSLWDLDVDPHEKTELLVGLDPKRGVLYLSMRDVMMGPPSIDTEGSGSSSDPAHPGLGRDSTLDDLHEKKYQKYKAGFHRKVKAKADDRLSAQVGSEIKKMMRHYEGFVSDMRDLGDEYEEEKRWAMEP